MRSYSVRGAPEGALTRAAFARACGVDRTCVWRWERTGKLRARYVFSAGYARPYYTADDVVAFNERKFWRSAKGVRTAQRVFRKKRDD